MWHGGRGWGYVGDDEVHVVGSVAIAPRREVPVGCLVDTHRGWVPVARVNAEGRVASLVGGMGGSAGESCREVGDAQFVHGVLDSYVGCCGWAGAVVIGGGGVYVANDDGGCHKGEAAVRQAQGVKKVLGLLPEWDVRE